MAQFFISLLFFVVALTFFWAVLHWVEYKKGETACACGSGSCSTDVNHSVKNAIIINQINLDKNIIHQEHEHDDCHSCNFKGADTCTCDS
ncbi:MAG: hypothetical protein KAR38_04160 [Calditrichia bacterium]|nr:hypothetical protein [Calditrichia bacterium]